MKTPVNLRKRLITGGILLIAMLGILIIDHDRTWCLFTCIFALSWVAAFEIVNLLTQGKPRLFVVLPILLALVLIEWISTGHWMPTLEYYFKQRFISDHVIPVVAIGLCIALIVELLLFRNQSQSTYRIANTALIILYLGVLPLFLFKIRQLQSLNGTLALAATIFVPKLGDVGAYFVGSLIGKHKMTPTLSPKKTWEGFFGGLIVSILTAIVINQISPEPLFKKGLPEAAAFGLLVGLAGVFGDLFASMIKRDAQVKDASQTIPGFGGVLDVVDSVLFAAPVAYLFFVL